ncbi:MAG: hypothetical protein P1U34_00120 [Coxiellaceae bacterium]|nr:hypothetical protein [Coxiellaceae bacterium]
MRQNNVNFVDFDKTLTKRHTVTTTPCRFFGEGYFRDDQLTVEAQIELGYSESEDNLKNDILPGLIQLGEGTVSAVATFGNNHAYIAGYLARHLGVGADSVKLDRVVFENEDEGATAQFATAVYNVEGLDKPLCISHIHAPGNDADIYKAFVAQFETADAVGKNRQLSHLKNVMQGLGHCSDADTYVLYDDSETNCTKAVELDFISSAYQVDGGNEAFTIARSFGVAAIAAPVPAPTVATAREAFDALFPADTIKQENISDAESYAKKYPGAVVLYKSSTTGSVQAVQYNPTNGGFLFRTVADFLVLNAAAVSTPEGVRGLFITTAEIEAQLSTEAVVRRVTEELKSYASVQGVELQRPQAEALALAYPGRPILRYSSNAQSMVATYFSHSEGVMKHDALSDLIRGDIGQFSSAGAVVSFVQSRLGGKAVVRPIEVAYHNITTLMAGIGKDDAVIVAPSYVDQLIVRESSKAGAFAITVCVPTGDVRHVLLDAATIQASIAQLQTVDSAKDFISRVCGDRAEFVTPDMAQAILNPAPASAAAGGMFSAAPAVPEDAAAEDPRPPTPPRHH